MPSEPNTEPTLQSLTTSILNQRLITSHHGSLFEPLKDVELHKLDDISQRDSYPHEAPHNGAETYGTGEEILDKHGHLNISRLVSKEEEHLRYPRQIPLDEDAPSLRSEQDNDLPYKVKKKKTDGDQGPSLDKYFSNEILTLIISYLPVTTISTTALVSKGFYAIVNSPHVWRIAFSRFFPGQDAEFNTRRLTHKRSDLDSATKILSETRLFNRLTSHASWRSEYMNRTRLLRCLGRGRPTQKATSLGVSPTHSNNASQNKSPVITYSSRLEAPIDRIHATFNSENNFIRFIHGNSKSGSVTTSDPRSSKAESWGLGERQEMFRHNELWTWQQPFGLDDGPTCVPNSMDLSHPFGAIIGEGFPGGRAYFRCKKEMRSRYLHDTGTIANHELGIPTIPKNTDAISAVWIAKSFSIPKATEGLIGMLLGSTLGIVTAYSLGVENHLTNRIPKGTITAKWILSPGVPIVAFDVDDSYNINRKDRGRIWAVALNALGELFYITKVPSSSLLKRKVEGNEHVAQAWHAGRTVRWNLVEASIRVARDDTYHDLDIDASYIPRSSCAEMNLSREQLVFETCEIEKFLHYPPSHFRKICHGWDMQQSLYVDFAGSNIHGAGEAIFIIKRGVSRGQQAQVKRLTRWKQNAFSDHTSDQPAVPQNLSLIFTLPPSISSPTASVNSARSHEAVGNSDFPRQSGEIFEEWRSSLLSLGGHPNVELTCSGIDTSMYALMTVDEDPMYSCSSTIGPSPPTKASALRGELFIIPGNRARYLAVGTKTGSLIIWNMRGPQPINSLITNEIHPLCTIQTDSPQISCLALSALYIVHGGNDGLVQAWDLLASSSLPIRTLNSRSSTVARRRLLHVDPMNPPSSNNLHATGVISLDPDPTNLRGIVSFGTHLKYWEYSSAGDENQKKKRRQRRSGFCENHHNPDRFTVNGRGALKEFIVTEYNDLKSERLRKLSEDNHLRCRFGVGLADLTEDEALVYAEMISAQEYAGHHINNNNNEISFPINVEEKNLKVSCCRPGSSSQNPDFLSGPIHGTSESDFELDIEKAIRLSLLENLSNENSTLVGSKSGASI
ncbi:hypothetical protein K3495_g6038 [Podosphaera aphanis]|nr:hypothetical protein K3495_g6038 [Podosphaera aphanis]